MAKFSKKGKSIMKFFSNLFTETSPFDQLYEHSDKVHDTVEALVKELKSYSHGDKVKGEQVSNLEFEADQKKQEIRHDLPRSDLLMPVARSDLLSLLWNQDEIADNSQDVAELLPMLELKTNLPGQYTAALDNLGDKLESAVKEYGQLIRKAGEVIQGKSSEVQSMEEIFSSIENINEIEHEADQTTRKAIKAVYQSDELEDIEKYHLIQVALKINNTLDHVENAGNFIRIMTNK
jgi:predicted phosphate transport protein (TIGR00153 family)